MTYDLHDCLLYLRPGAAFGTTDNDYALTEWKGPRPMPTEAECLAAWLDLQVVGARSAYNTAIIQEMDAADLRIMRAVIAGDAGRIAQHKIDQAERRARLK